jgi:SET domain-containing protein
MIHPFLYIAETAAMGRGVFTSGEIEEKVLIEISPVLVMTKEERTLLDKTRLYNYIFEWGEDKDQCCMALGYLAIYNHSYGSNCEYEMNYEKETITVKTIRSIKAGEELFINYNGDWNDETPLWFDAK